MKKILVILFVSFLFASAIAKPIIISKRFGSSTTTPNDNICANFIGNLKNHILTINITDYFGEAQISIMDENEFPFYYNTLYVAGMESFIIELPETPGNLTLEVCLGDIVYSGFLENFLNKKQNTLRR